MADLLDQVAAGQVQPGQPGGGDLLDQVHAQSQPDTSTVGGMLQSYWHQVNPAARIAAMAHPILHPLDTLETVANNTAAAGKAAVDAFGKGDYAGGVKNAFSYLTGGIPTMEPVAFIGAVKKAASGDIPGALTDASAEATNALENLALQKAQEVIPGKVAGVAKRVIQVKSTLNPVQQAAADYLQGEGANLPVGTVTGNKFIQGVQKLAATSPMGAGVAADAARVTEGALQRTAGNLAAQASPTPASPESAGAAAGAQLNSNIAGLKLQEDAAYSGAWQGADDPANTVSVPVKTMQRPITDNVGRATGKTESVPVMADVQAPVDVRGIKQQLQPVYDSMQWMPASDRASSAGYQAVSNILKGPDFIPAQAAEQGRSGLLTMARVDNPNLRNASQGMAAGIVPDLTEGIDAAVAKLGPDNLAALQKGRATHASKMDVADLADKLRDEPVQAFNQLTWAKDTGIDFLRKVQEQAPDVMPQVGRAYIQKLFDTATKEGGFSHSQTISSQWDNLGPETKKLLYPNPELRSSLDKFFLGAKMVADNPNPSGTALVAQTSALATGMAGSGILALTQPHIGVPALVGQGMYLLGGRAVAKLLYSPAGVRLLTGALQAESPGAAALRASQILRITGDDDVTPIPPGGSPPSTPPSGAPPRSSSPSEPPPAPGGGSTGGGNPNPAAGAQAQPPNPNIPPGLDKASNPRAWMRPGTPGSGLGTSEPLQSAPQSTTLPSGPIDANDSNLRTGDGAGQAAHEAPGVGPAASLSPAGRQGTGRQTTVSLNNDTGRLYQAEYGLRELSDVQTSHNGISFGPNPKYGPVNDRDYSQPENQAKVFNGATPARFNPARLINTNPTANEGPIVVDSNGNALGGNGRGMILQRVYANNPAGAQAYRDLLTRNAAHFGIDPAEIAGMKQPVLVREIPDSQFTEAQTRQQAITDFNDDSTASLTPSEKSIADSRRVSQGTLDDIAQRLDAGGPSTTLSKMLSGPGGADVLQKLIKDGAINSQESAAYISNGDLTAAAKTRISKALLGRFFRDPAQIDRINDYAPSIVNKLERMAAPLAQIESDPQWSLTPIVQGAIDMIEDAQAHSSGKSLGNFAKQSGLFGEQQYGQVLDMARHLQGTGANILTNAVRIYTQDARAAGEEPGMFGKPEVPAPAEAFSRAVKVSSLQAKIATAETALRRPNQTPEALDAGRAALQKLQAALGQL